MNVWQLYTVTPWKIKEKSHPVYICSSPKVKAWNCNYSMGQTNLLPNEELHIQEHFGWPSPIAYRIAGKIDAILLHISRDSGWVIFFTQKNLVWLPDFKKKQSENGLIRGTIPQTNRLDYKLDKPPILGEEQKKTSLKIDSFMGSNMCTTFVERRRRKVAHRIRTEQQGQFNEPTLLTSKY